MTFLLLSLNNMDMNKKCDEALAKLDAQEITFQEFLKEVGSYQNFEKWCAEHYLKVDEGAAQLYFDYYGFEDETIVKEFVQPLAS